MRLRRISIVRWEVSVSEEPARAVECRIERRGWSYVHVGFVTDESSHSLQSSRSRLLDDSSDEGERKASLGLIYMHVSLNILRSSMQSRVHVFPRSASKHDFFRLNIVQIIRHDLPLTSV